MAGLGAVAPLFAVTACEVALPGAPNCPVTPNNSYWHANVSALPVSSHSADLRGHRRRELSPLHADFGSGTWDGGPIGIPYTTVPGTQAKVKITFVDRRRERSRPLPDPGQRARSRGARRRPVTAT